MNYILRRRYGFISHGPDNCWCPLII